MADSSKSKSGGGCLAKLMVLFLLLVGSGLGVALFFVCQPQDLTDIGGYGPSAKTAPVRDMKVVLKNSIDRGYTVTLTETEINQWLARTISMKQGGLLASQISLDRVWVRLLDGHAEVVMERTIMGRPFTLSMFLMVEQMQDVKGVNTAIQPHGGPYHASIPVPLRGGRFGRLVVPQGFLHLIVPAYEKLAACMAGEKELIGDMARIRIEKNRLVLDPRGPSDDLSGLPKTF